jgi:hypothetical protein
MLFNKVCIGKKNCNFSRAANFSVGFNFWLLIRCISGQLGTFANIYFCLAYQTRRRLRTRSVLALVDAVSTASTYRTPFQTKKISFLDHFVDKNFCIVTKSHFSGLATDPIQKIIILIFTTCHCHTTQPQQKAISYVRDIKSCLFM